jgi:hypothetical protein
MEVTMVKRRLIILILLIVLPLVGCTEQRRPRWQAIAVEHASFDDVWTTCLASLQDRGLSIDRQDRRFGLIVSEPVVGKQFFEFWRNDAVTSDDTWTSSLHTVRRIVSIHVVSQGPMHFEVRVQAQAQRVNIPADQLDNTAEAFEMIRVHGVPASPSRRDYTRPKAELIWVDIGREHALEQYILEDITRRLEKS